MGIMNEFKKFIARGNVMDMAVGVVIGGAFKSIIDSLVNDIIMPALSMVTGKVNISSLAVSIPDPLNPDQVLISLNYGNFLQQILNFLIIAFSIFCVVKGINTLKDRLSKQAEAEQDAAPAAPTQEELLAEIKDTLVAIKEQK